MIKPKTTEMEGKRTKALLTAREKQAVINYCNEQKGFFPYLTKTEIGRRAAKTFLISESQVGTIIDNYEKGLPTTSSNKGGAKTQNQVDDFYMHFLKTEIANKIHSFHEKNQHFTIKDLYNHAVNHLEYTECKTTLYKIIKSMGFRYKKCDNKKILCESSHVQVARVKFLRKYIEYMQASAEIVFVFIDETWIYQNGSQIRTWTHDDDEKAHPKRIKSEGRRFTVLHAGCKYGFLEGCSLLLDTKIEHRDYHHTMNGDVFKKWVQEQLIPGMDQLQKKCIVIMDNASYHTVKLEKPPNSSSSKQSYKYWLIKHKVQFDDNMLKKQLWDIIKPLINDTKTTYVIDELLKLHGYEVLRLPGYHCQYNAIELVWGFAKNYYNKNILKTETVSDLKGCTRTKSVWKEGLSKFTAEMWNNSVVHCEKLILQDWKKYMGDLPVQSVPPLVISLTEESDDSDLPISDSE